MFIHLTNFCHNVITMIY